MSSKRTRTNAATVPDVSGHELPEAPRPTLPPGTQPPAHPAASESTDAVMPAPEAIDPSQSHALQHVELIRTRILRGQMGELVRLRSYLSVLGGNQPAVDRLRGKGGDLILARVSDFILRELGHAEALPVEHKDNKTRREASGSNGKTSVK